MRSEPVDVTPVADPPVAAERAPRRPAHAPPPTTIFLASLEPSADRHAAALINAIRRQRPDARFVGIAGPRMIEAGCEALCDLTLRAAMLYGAVGLVGTTLDLLRRIDRLFAEGVADVFVPVDSPAFNLLLARRAKARGLPVVYYIAPQVWAWAEYRVGKVRRRTDRLAVILPFEEPYFRGHGIDATFVGHPLVEAMEQSPPDPAAVARWRGVGEPIITCLPGSRRHVVTEVLPTQVAVCRQIVSRYPRAAFLFAAANDARAAEIRAGLAAEGNAVAARSHVAIGENDALLSAADLVLVASGTAALEVACHHRPMVVMYNASRWGYHLVARWLIRTKYLSLVNILAQRPLVPEFMPYVRSVDEVARAALDLLGDAGRRERVCAELTELVASLGRHRAADETASIVLDACDRLGRRRTGPRGSRHRIW